MKHFPTMAYSVFNGKDYAPLDSIAFNGLCILRSETPEFFCSEESKPYFSNVMDSPTWGQVFLESMKAQQATLDFHHCYLEGLKPVKTEDGIAILSFVLGS